MRTTFALVTLAALLGLGASASAQDTCRADIDAGLAMRQQGDDEGARARFAAAVAACHSGESLAQLALAEQALGQWVDAELHLAAALERSEPSIDDNRDVLAGALETIRGHLGDLELRCAVPGATVRVAGRDVGTTPLAEPLRVEAGPVVVQVTAQGHVPLELTVEVRAGQLTRRQIALVEAVRTAPPVVDVPDDRDHPEPPRTIGSPRRIPQPTPSSTSPTLIAGLVLGGVAILTLGGTLAAVGVRESSIARWNDDSRCDPEPSGRDAACPGLQGTFTTAGDLALAGGIVTSALAVTTAVLLIVSVVEGEAVSARWGDLDGVRF